MKLEDAMTDRKEDIAWLERVLREILKKQEGTR